MNKSEKSDVESIDARFLDRRRFIRRQFRQEGKVTEEAMRNFLSEKEYAWSLSAMRKDIEFVRRYEDRTIFENCDSKAPKGKQFEWIDISRKLSKNRIDRLQHNNEGKQAIADVLASLTVGFGPVKMADRSQKSGTSAEYFDKVIERLSVVVKRLKKPSVSILDKLQVYWHQGERRMFLDSGTTTQVFSDSYLQNYQFPIQLLGATPDNNPCINKLEVVTNDRYIYYNLGDANVQTRVIVVGGHQQYGSSAISGAMAEKFLDKTKITAHLAIVGATAICIRSEPGAEAYIAAQDEHVANIKMRFLERADIRIIIADGSKFFTHGGHTDYRICPIHEKYVDLVITDKATPKIVELFEKLEIPLLDTSTI